MTADDLRLIIDAVEEHHHKLLDDNLSGTQLVQADAIGIHHRLKETTVVALFRDRTHYILNSLYVDETGRPHISTKVAGGRIMPMGDLDQAVQEYNIAGLISGHGRIDHIVQVRSKKP